MFSGACCMLSSSPIFLIFPPGPRSSLKPLLFFESHQRMFSGACCMLSSSPIFLIFPPGPRSSLKPLLFFESHQRMFSGACMVCMLSSSPIFLILPLAVHCYMNRGFSTDICSSGATICRIRTLLAKETWSKAP